MIQIKNMLWILLFFSFCYAEESILSKLDNTYKNINDVKGNFIQKSYIKELDKAYHFMGKFFIKHDKIRWQYTGDFSQIVYLNRESLIVYDKKRRQAIKTDFTEEKYGQLPIALLSRIAQIEKDFETIEKSENSLILIPKTKIGSVKKVELFISDNEFPVKSLRLTDIMQNTIKIEFYDVKINTGLSDSLFNFVPKKDDTVLQY